MDAFTLKRQTILYIHTITAMELLLASLRLRLFGWKLSKGVYVCAIHKNTKFHYTANKETSKLKKNQKLYHEVFAHDTSN